MTTDYRSEAKSDARETVENFISEIAEKLANRDEASDDLLNDYPNGDAWHHENHVDKSYDLTEAAELLDDLGDCEETDTGLWEGLAPREAISAQAAYTYGNAVYEQWRELIREINDAADELWEAWDETEEATDAEVSDDERQKQAEALIRKVIADA